eukprot:4562381-Heterocapsa_arctica.AAC.1
MSMIVKPTTSSSPGADQGLPASWRGCQPLLLHRLDGRPLASRLREGSAAEAQLAADPLG